MLSFGLNPFLASALVVLLGSYGLLLADALSATGHRLLMVDESGLVNNYKAWISDLEQHGYKITYESPKSDNLALFEHGERKYDHIILLPPKSRAYGPKLTSQLLLEFMKQNGNIMVLLSPSNVPEQLRELGRELDINLAPRDNVVTDHFSWLPGIEGNEDKQDIIAVKKPIDNEHTRNYFGSLNGQEEYVAFRGVGHTLGNSPLVNPILSVPRTAYSWDNKEEHIRTENPWSAGQQLHLVSGVQARNNARITFVGGAEIFNDEFQALDGLRLSNFGHKVVVNNRWFALAVTGWTFQEKGVLKVDSVQHHKQADKPSDPNPGIYRIKEDVSFAITLSEWNENKWQPYITPAEDQVQLEFIMLDPYYRLSLNKTATTLKSSTFSTSFMLPDQHGVFKFRVNYKRPFVSYIDEQHSVVVRHFAHNEFTRSWAISGAWVWIAGLAVTVFGWICFCALWLWTEPKNSKEAVKKNQ